MNAELALLLTRRNGDVPLPALVVPLAGAESAGVGERGGMIGMARASAEEAEAAMRRAGARSFMTAIINSVDRCGARWDNGNELD